MANTLTNLIPELYSAVDVVSRELVGFIPAVSMNATADMAAKDETIRVPVTQAQAAGNITPGVTPPDDGDQTIANVDMTISKSRRVPIRWNGEQTKGFGNTGTMNVILRDQFAQAMRTLANEVEADLASLYAKASRGYGTAGDTPFASTLGDSAQVRKILADNGAPMTDLQMVINTAAGANLRTLTQLTKANEAGTMDTLRRGVLLDVHGFMIRESAQIANHTAGTGASATTNTAGYAVGATTLTLASAGTGTILAGDLITIAGDANKYLVVSGDADVSGGGTITIAEPGLKKAIGASATAITVVKDATTLDYAPNMAFHRGAIQLLTRVPARPMNGDMAVGVELVTDPVSGITFSVAEYKQYHQTQYEVGLAWGYQLIKPQHVALLVG